MKAIKKANAIAKYMGEHFWATSKFHYAYQSWKELFPVLEKIGEEEETPKLWRVRYEITPSYVRIGNVLIEDVKRETPVVQMARQAVLQWLKDRAKAASAKQRLIEKSVAQAIKDGTLKNKL